jgi:inhibitor of nuclear factor kappa-B kinase subunit alpha
MAKDMNISRRSLSRVIHDDLHLKSYKTKPREALNPRQMAARVEKAQKLKRLVGATKLAKVVFTDEKIFTLDETGKHPLVKFHCKPGQQQMHITNSTRSMLSHSPGVMVWGGVSKKGKTPLIFVEPGVKINASYYQNDILSKFHDWCIVSFHDSQNILLQQDWAPAHSARSTKNWLRAKNMPFWDQDVYPAASPDLNPMDYSIWGWMLECLRDLHITSIVELKVKLLEIWENLCQKSIDLAIDQLPKRLDSLINARGARFE